MEPIDPAAIEMPVTQPIDITFLLDGAKPADDIEEEQVSAS
jgi:hypothetical protein